jgi:transposase
MKDESTASYVAYIGIDWADKEHAYALRSSNEETDSKLESGKLTAKPEAIEEFVVKLRKRFQGGQIAVALEQNRGALFFTLSKYDHLVLHSVHPNTLDNYRKARHPSGAKSDPDDAKLILEVLEKHQDWTRQFSSDTLATRTLQFLTEERRDAVDDKTRYVNQLTAGLKAYFPQMLEWLDADSKLLCEMLKQWPTLEQLQQQEPAVVREFLRTRRYPAERVESLLELIPQAIPATTDQAVIQARKHTVQRVIGQLETLRVSIANLEGHIEKLARAHEDYEIYASLPCAGKVTISRMIAAMGTQRERFQTANDLQCLSGIAPVKEASGQKEWVHWRWACPKFMRQTFVEWAALSIRESEWAREFYDSKKADGKSHHAAVRALAFKWQRIIFRCWKDRCPYDESRYLTARSQRRQKPKVK